MHCRIAILFCCVVISVAAAITMVSAHGDNHHHHHDDDDHDEHDHVHVGGRHHDSPPESEAAAATKLEHPEWEQHRVAFPPRTPMRIVQLDFAAKQKKRSVDDHNNEGDDDNDINVCDAIEVGDVWDVDIGAPGPSSLFKVDIKNNKPCESAAEQEGDEKEEEGKGGGGGCFSANSAAQHLAPFARSEHGMLGAYTKHELQHHIWVLYKVEEDELLQMNGDSGNNNKLLNRQERKKRTGSKRRRWVSSSFADPRLHVGEARTQKHDAVQHKEQHHVFYVEGEESHNLRLPRSVATIYVACGVGPGNGFQFRSFDVHQLHKEAPKVVPGTLRAPGPLLRRNRNKNNNHDNNHGEKNQNREAEEQAATAAASASASGGATVWPVVRMERISGPPRTQLNIIFLSAGFTKEQEGKYNQSLAAAIEFFDPRLTDKAADPDLYSMHMSVPWDRYFPFTNVYSVWQASKQEGASRPKTGLKVDNNLGCFHPETIERACTCQRKLVMALADMTPAKPLTYPDQSVIVTIVNTPIYGGSAQFRSGSEGYHVSYFYQGRDPATTASSSSSGTASAPTPPTSSGSSSSSSDSTTTFDKLKYASLIKHEVAHAYGSLFDEYDIGTATTSKMDLPNCAQEANNPPWSAWAAIFADKTKSEKYKTGIRQPDLYGIASSALPVCGYSNYYKPNSNCMMQNLRDYFMCPVCRDAATRTMFSLSNMKTSWPRSPTEDATLIIPQSDSNADVLQVSTGIVLHLPAYVVPDNSFVVRWFDAAGVEFTDAKYFGMASCPACLRLDAAYLTALPTDTLVLIKASIEDQTNFVLPSLRTGATFGKHFLQNATFKIKKVAAVDKATQFLQQKLPPKGSPVGFQSGVDDKLFYTECLPSAEAPEPICNLTFTPNEYKAPDSLGLELAGAQVWVYAVLGGVALVFLLFWVMMHWKFSSLEDQRPRPVLESKFVPIVQVIYNIMNVSSILFMLLAIATLVAAGVMYGNVSAVGQIVAWLGMALAIGIFIMGSIGFWALKMRSMRLVVVNGVCLYGGFTVLFAITALLMNVGNSIQDRRSYWNRNLRRMWVDQVANAPSRACGLQGMLECSGFYLSCGSVGASPEFCPANCDGPNLDNAVPCQKRIQDWIHNNYTNVMGVTLICSILMCFALLFNFIYFYNLVKLKADLRRSMMQRVKQSTMAQYGRAMEKDDPVLALMILQQLSGNEATKMLREFKRIDTSGDGELSPAEVFTFFKKTIPVRVNMEQIEYLFSIADKDNSGTISVGEFMALFTTGEEVAKRHYQDDPRARARIAAVSQSKEKSAANVSPSSSYRGQQQQYDPSLELVGGILDRWTPGGAVTAHAAPATTTAGFGGMAPTGGLKGGANAAAKKPPTPSSAPAPKPGPKQGAAAQRAVAAKDNDDVDMDELLGVPGNVEL